MAVTLSNAKTTLMNMYLNQMFNSGSSITPTFLPVDTSSYRDYLTNPYILGDNTSTNSSTSTTTKTNHNPVGTATSFSNGEEDISYRFTSALLLSGFSDPDGDTLSVLNVSTTNGKINVNTDGSWTLVPDMNFNGVLKLNYTVSDNKGGIANASTDFILNPVNDAPIGKSALTFAPGIENFTKFTLKDSDLLQGFSDPDGDALQTDNISVTNAEITKIDNTTWMVQPNKDFSGVIEITYNVTDKKGGSISAKNSVIVSNNNGNDLIIGTESNDVLDGGLGKDMLIGKNGDDIYIVDNIGDKIIEELDGGYDTVNSLINYTLGNNLENLELVGDGKLKGIGNELDNSIIGNNNNNILKGMSGDDVLIGGLGSDTLTGGKGGDTFSFSSSDFYTVNSNGDLVFNKSVDTITDFNLKEHDVIDLGDLGQLTFYSSINAAQDDIASLFYVKSTGKIYLNTNEADGFTPSVIIIISGKPAVNVDMTDFNYPV